MHIYIATRLGFTNCSFRNSCLFFSQKMGEGLYKGVVAYPLGAIPAADRKDTMTTQCNFLSQLTQIQV